ncbi:hypothetical protein H696_06153, partial [Fonticula alba]
LPPPYGPAPMQLDCLPFPRRLPWTRGFSLAVSLGVRRWPSGHSQFVRPSLLLFLLLACPLCRARPRPAPLSPMRRPGHPAGFCQMAHPWPASVGPNPFGVVSGNLIDVDCVEGAAGDHRAIGLSVRNSMAPKRG